MIKKLLLSTITLMGCFSNSFSQTGPLNNLDFEKWEVVGVFDNKNVENPIGWGAVNAEQTQKCTVAPHGGLFCTRISSWWPIGGSKVEFGTLSCGKLNMNAWNITRSIQSLTKNITKVSFWARINNLDSCAFALELYADTSLSTNNTVIKYFKGNSATWTKIDVPINKSNQVAMNGFALTFIAPPSGTQGDYFDIDDITVEYEGSQGINEYSKNEMSLYPNPSNGLVYVSSIVGSVNLFVYDMIGNLISSIKSENGSTPIDLSHQAAGTYFVKIENKESIITKKLIITK